MVERLLKNTRNQVFAFSVIIETLFIRNLSWIYQIAGPICSSLNGEHVLEIPLDRWTLIYLTESADLQTLLLLINQMRYAPLPITFKLLKLASWNFDRLIPLWLHIKSEIIVKLHHRRGGSYILSIWKPELTLTQLVESQWYDKQKNRKPFEFFYVDTDRTKVALQSMFTNYFFLFFFLHITAYNSLQGVYHMSISYNSWI